MMLADWNAMNDADAEGAVLACNGSRVWARNLVYGRPYPCTEAVLQAADKVWWRLREADWKEAYATHPRIGEHHAGAATAASLRWSEEEQAAAAAGEQAELRQANQDYEAKFGRTFLICARGRTQAEILVALLARLGRTAQQEMMEAAEQQRQITQLRLRLWLEGDD